MALKQLKDNKVPGEMLEAGGKTVLKALQKIFHSVIVGGKPPRAASGAFLQKYPESYKSIYLMIHAYNLFSKVITSRFERKLDNWLSAFRTSRLPKKL